MQDCILTQFKHFRDKMHSLFQHRADATMELIDALSANQHARSITELSLNEPFRRQYGSIRDAIAHFNQEAEQIKSIESFLIQQCDPISKTRPFKLLALDCTSAPRQYSKTLSDRGIVYKPTPTPGSKPIAVGHQYSVMGFLPEQTDQTKKVPWILPISTQRVETETNSIQVGIEQLNTTMSSLNSELAVNVVDSAYSCPEYIEATQQHSNLILIARLRSNRVLNHPPQPKQQKITKRRQRGHELWYGESFNLKASDSWGTPANTLTHSFFSRKGKQHQVIIQSWENILMRQKRGIRLNEYPFSVVRITVTDENNHSVYNRPMWLMVSGKRRFELDLLSIWSSYKQRFDIEHFFKFGKERLLMDRFQTPDTLHEESWWQITILAYAQLYKARKIAKSCPNPWEKYLPEMKKNGKVMSARQTQKSFLRITRKIGTPASFPKPRGNPLGRKTGAKQPKRERYLIVIKAKVNEKNAA